MASTAAVNNSPSPSGLPHHNEPARNNPVPSHSPTSSVRHLATSDEVQRREVATLSTLLRAASGEIPRALGVAGFSVVFAYAGQKAVLALMKNQKAKPTLVVAGGVGDATSGVAKEFARAFLANYFPTLKVPNHAEGSRWPLTKQAGTTLVLNGVAEGLFHFLAGLSNSFGISKEMSYYGVDHIPDKSEAYLKILKDINPNEIWSPLAVKAGSEFVKDVIIVLGIAFAFKRAHPEHDFQMCRKFNMRKVLNTALLNSAARGVVAVCSGAWVNSNQNTSQTAFMFTGARNASLPAVLNFIRVVSMGIMLAAFMNKLGTGRSPIDAENGTEESGRENGNDLIPLPSLEPSRVVEIADASDAPEQSRADDDVSNTSERLRADEDVSHASERSRADDNVSHASERSHADDVSKTRGSDNLPAPQPRLTTNLAASSQPEDVTEPGATDTSSESKESGVTDKFAKVNQGVPGE